MGKIIWTNKSVAHLKALHDYIAEDSPVYAVGFVKALIKSTRKLEAFPLCGRIVPEFQNSSLNFREVIYKGYRIIYRIMTNSDIEIITVAHGREDIYNNLDKDWIL